MLHIDVDMFWGEGGNSVFAGSLCTARRVIPTFTPAQQDVIEAFRCSANPLSATN